MTEPAIVALTLRGLDLAGRLAHALGRGQVFSAQGTTRQTLEDLFRARRPLVCIMALGIVVRILGPLAADKQSDPPVVVVDESGQFAVSVLGGHGAGANELTNQVARAIGAVPVITTASDALGLPAVDLIGRQWGWKIEKGSATTKVAAAVVRGERILVWQEVGRRDWCTTQGDRPGNFEEIDSWPPLQPGAALAITDRCLSLTGCGPTIVYRPPTLVLGVGCRRGVPCAEIEALFEEVCRKGQWAPLSLGTVATASIKADEPGLKEFAAWHGVPLLSFSLAELGSVSPLPTPSAVVRTKIGIAGVAEPAAMLAAGCRSLVMPKYRGRRATMALARRRDA